MKSVLKVTYWDCPDKGCAYGLSVDDDGDKAIWQRSALVAGGYDEACLIDEDRIELKEVRDIYDFCRTSARSGVAPVMVDIVVGGESVMTVMSV